MELSEYAGELLQETLASAVVAEDSGSRLEVFTELVAQRLEEAGDFSEATVAFHKSRGIEVSGFALGEDDTSLHLFVTDFRPTLPFESLTDTQIRQMFARLETFVERSLNGYAEKLEESSRAFELADLIYQSRKRLDTVALYLFSNAKARQPNVPAARIEGLQVIHQVWDLERLYRLDTSGIEREPISVDVVARNGSPIACLAGREGSDHRVFLMILGGDFIADLYGEFGSRLLERNVRSFLQARGAVNRGIRDTIKEEPSRFLAFNNGISATASSVELVALSTGGTGIARIDDLQVVNGGQTTASLHSAKKKDHADLSEITVQCKLTVVPSDKIDELVPFISRYSNTQNKVTTADFSANDKFHVAVEALSRSIWAPAGDGTQRQTHWFYERARGQYADQLAREGTPAAQRQFKLMNPTQQKFSKTDLAKFEHSWEELPYLVSLGAEKNFREFMIRLAERPVQPDVGHYERLIAKAILFRKTEKIVSSQLFGGYRANIVTYSIAKLAHEVAHRLDLYTIWKNQAISEATSDAIEEISQLTHEIITKPSGSVKHIGEWSKKIDCWRKVEELKWDVPKNLERELISLASTVGAPSSRIDRGLATTTDEEEGLIAEAQAVSAEDWFGLSNWAKETGNLRAWERSLAYSLGRLAANGRSPSVKQARQGLRILQEGRRLGL